MSIVVVVEKQRNLVDVVWKRPKIQDKKTFSYPEPKNRDKKKFFVIKAVKTVVF